MRKLYKLSLYTIVLLLHGMLIGQKTNQISLAGNWSVKLDSLDKGSHENWASQNFEGLTIKLPGTLDDAGIGHRNTLKPALNNYVLSNLTRKHQYIGKAWYQKEINIPKSWKKKEVKLTLERVIWESQVFVDGKLAGRSESLVGAHEYNLTSFLSPGKHLLTIVIDNSNKYPFINVAGSKYPDPINQDMAHGYTNHTQIKWNGIIGNILLEASTYNTPENLQIFPDVENKILMVSFEQAKPVSKKIIFELSDQDGKIIYTEIVNNAIIQGNLVSFKIDKPEKLEFWDEFHPVLYQAKVISQGQDIQTKFGYRKVENTNGVLSLNDERIFLRGNLECVIFPLTGYPPMEKWGWTKLIEQAKNYGLNHLRFHSWCPPKAAFEAADEAGFYFQVELPHWSLKVGEDENTTLFLRNEAAKILNDYGNHPSFILMALGNELQGDIGLLNRMTAELKKKDSRHLYATTSFSFQKPTGTRPEKEDEFFIAQWTDKGWIRGQGIFNDKPPHFNADYSANSDHIQVPLISHEIGQYSVYPDLTEIPDYSGVLEPLNFLAVRNALQKKGMLDLAGDFTQASGKLAAMLYKEEIERALKTNSFDGFQLLQLQDFPGQGTALVGLLNAFWESKGIISPEEFRKFNSPLVPLIRYEKAIYVEGENFLASIEVANYLKKLENQTIEWQINNEEGNVLFKGAINNLDLTIGNNMELGKIAIPIKIEKAQEWNIEIKLKGTAYQNSWPIWVYPSSKLLHPKNIIITSSFEEAKKALGKGKKVFLNPDLKQLKGNDGRFTPVFWSPVHFPDQPGTMGLLIDNEHKALQDFPTQSYTQWQWWDLCINSKASPIDTLPVKPIVRVVDNFVTNKHLANIFEVKIGNGKLLFSSMDLHSDLENRPAARQLRQSLLNYMESEAFDPVSTITANQLETLKLE
ncbi:glycoside hydrolase family 2 [Arenibacter aquaticus]|uniref:Glycoside hydrolase family 2 n=1 Tax=Arenibacter aquaticus TaxID=2489054 RepID=A0A430K575_9FLAO|nr:sugar-binding domain-containing protein [Arenibacter aquaticus]RTE54193.1 glycoside hydrolase family 2 [Arenibacter aquaticus]